MLMTIMLIVQFCFTVVIGVYFLFMLRNQFSGRSAIQSESTKELERLRRMNGIKLSEPLTEKTRPRKVEEIVGQEEGIKALRCALCGENPQHVLIYGPPGVGKTAASRVVLNEAKKILSRPLKSIRSLLRLMQQPCSMTKEALPTPL